MGRFGTALFFVACGGLFAWFVWRGYKSGRAVFGPSVTAERRGNPVGFWIIQSVNAGFSVLLLLVGLSLLLGVLPYRE